MQCAESIMQYVIFMINILNERNLGPKHDTLEYLLKTFEKFDPDQTETISTDDLSLWMNEMVGGLLNAETINELVDGADIDCDNIINYKQHLHMIADTFLNLNSKQNQVIQYTIYRNL